MNVTMQARGRLKAMLAILAFGVAMLPALAVAGPPFAELRGVPELLGASSLAVEAEWIWATLLLLAVVAALWIFHRRDRRK